MGPARTGPAMLCAALVWAIACTAPGLTRDTSCRRDDSTTVHSDTSDNSYVVPDAVALAVTDPDPLTLRVDLGRGELLCAQSRGPETCQMVASSITGDAQRTISIQTEERLQIVRDAETRTRLWLTYVRREFASFTDRDPQYSTEMIQVAFDCPATN